MLEVLQPLAFVRRQPRALARIPLGLPDPGRNVSAVHPIFAATADSIGTKLTDLADRLVTPLLGARREQPGP